jgi:hypothetical protein
MRTIAIQDLQPLGSDLFADSESYLRELSEEEELGLLGGKTSVSGSAVSIVGSAIGSAIVTAVVVTIYFW